VAGERSHNRAESLEWCLGRQLARVYIIDYVDVLPIDIIVIFKDHVAVLELIHDRGSIMGWTPHHREHTRINKRPIARHEPVVDLE